MSSHPPLLYAVPPTPLPTSGALLEVMMWIILIQLWGSSDKEL